MNRDMERPSLAESLLPETLGQSERLGANPLGGGTGTGLGALVAEIYLAREGRPNYPQQGHVPRSRHSWKIAERTTVLPQSAAQVDSDPGTTIQG